MYVRLAFAIFLSCGICYATPVAIDSQKAVHITADHASFDHKNGLAVYEGHVEVDQGSRHLSANKVTIERDQQNRIKVMVATGNPATFKAQQNPNKNPGSGSAKIIKYYPQLDRVDLIDQAKLMQDGDTISGPKLSYNFVTEVLQGKSSQRERTTIILKPREKLK